MDKDNCFGLGVSVTVASGVLRRGVRGSIVGVAGGLSETVGPDGVAFAQLKAGIDEAPIVCQPVGSWIISAVSSA